MQLKGANPKAEVGGRDQLSGITSYFIGNDPRQWHPAIPTYGRVQYRDVYPGIDLTYYGNKRQLEYDFIVRPHADPRAIRIEFRGIRNMRVEENGDLVLGTSAGEIRHLKPSIYERDGDTKHFIDGRYAIRGRSEVGFEVGNYDPSKELIIDPIFVYSTFLGGTSTDVGKAIAVDSFGFAYVTGYTSSFNFPTTINAYSTTYSNQNDVFVTKLDQSGSSLVYSTFIGGAGNDVPSSIAIDSSGNAYLCGVTSQGSTNYPVTNGAYDTTPPAQFMQRGFVTKLNSNGTALVYSTYFGPNSFSFSQPANGINGIAVDSAGIAYITGAVSGTLPVTQDAHQSTSGGASDAFFTKINAAGSALLYSTYLGGAGQDTGNAIAIDTFGSAYIAGNTTSNPFPTTQGAFQTTFGGQGQFSSNILGDCFVAKYDSSGNLSYSTYVGGSTDEAAFGIAVDSAGNAYITGATTSSDFPTTLGVLRTAAGGAFKATDSGATWAPIDKGLTAANVQTLAIDPESPATVFAGTQTGGAFKSTDGGSDWTAINNGLTDLSIQSVAVDPTASTVIYLGTSMRGVFKSTDGGGSWRAVDTGEGGSSVTSLAIDPTSTGTVYAATSSGIFKTTSGGASWAAEPLPGFFGSVRSIALDPANHLTVYAATSGLGVFKSTNAGASWSQTALGSANVGVVALDQTSAIYGTTSIGIQKSTDGGATWTLEFAGLTDLNVGTLAVGNTALFAGTGTGVFKSTNGGASWALSNTGMVGSPVTALAIDPVTQSNVYAGSVGTSVDSFVTKLNPTGTGLVYSTYLGGNGSDEGTAIAIDTNNNAYVTGFTSSTNFPVSPGGVPGTGSFFGNAGFVTKLNSSGSGLVYSTLLDSQGSTQGNGIAVDSSFGAYVTGQTSDHNYPVTAGAYQTTFPSQFGSNPFVSKLESSPALSADLQVTQTVMPTGTVTGSLTYNITVTNHGPDTAYSLVLSDSVPGSLVVTNCFGSGMFCQQLSNAIVATANTLASGSMATLTISASVNCLTAVNGAMATNTVTVSSATPDPVSSNNTASVSNTVSNPFAPSLGTQSAIIPVGGTNFSQVSVTAPPCAWRAFSNVSWINIFFFSGSGVGVVDYSVQQNNTGLPRTGTMTIAGLTFTVHQAGGKTKLVTPGLYVPSSGTFFLRNSNSTGVADITFNYGPGGLGWLPLAGDWNGDGVDTVGLYDPATSTFFLRNSNSTGVADITFAFGVGGLGWIPLAGDWDGDGVTTVGLYNPSTGTFFLRNSNSAGPADITFAFGPGGLGWLPLAGDWNGDGITTVGLYNPTTGQFFLRNSNTTGVADITLSFGPGGQGWIALAGDWNADGLVTPGLYVPASGTFFLRNSNTTGVADVTFAFGPGGLGWKPIVGDWIGQ
jgi:photosystem II stability/assembly factor-like uncharacterized protein